MVVTPLVSIVIPTYNRAEIVGEAIDSILAQTFSECEIIVVDDGSVDHTADVVRAYGERIRYSRQNNRGVSAARNEGIGLAKAEWIAFLDSDDQWYPEYLEAQIKCIEDHPQVIAQIANVVSIQPDGRKVNHFQGTGLVRELAGRASVVIERPFSTVVRYAPWFVQCAVMKRRDLIACGLFDPALSIAEDFDLFARMSLRGSFGVQTQPLVKIFRHDESYDHLSRQVLTDAIGTLETYAKIISQLRRVESLNAKERRTLAVLMSSNRRALGKILMRKGDKSQAKAMFYESFKIAPHWYSAVRYLTAFLPLKIAKHLNW